jgi:hypothetical protein
MAFRTAVNGLRTAMMWPSHGKPVVDPAYTYMMEGAYQYLGNLPNKWSTAVPELIQVCLPDILHHEFVPAADVAPVAYAGSFPASVQAAC